MSKVKLYPYVRFWAAYDNTYETATYSLQMKAPEVGNTIRYARNQSTTRLRSGNVLVYDRGKNYNNTLSLQFRDITDTERAQLVVFLAAIGWAATKVTYRDMYGTEYVVRITGDNGVVYKDGNVSLKSEDSEVLWDFDLELLDLTGNAEELGRVDPAVASALTLHLSDYNHPHNPLLTAVVDIADGSAPLETQSVDTWRSITWLVTINNAAGSSANYVVTGEHDGTGSADAANVDYTILRTATVGTPPTVTFTVDLNGAGTSQVMRLKMATDTDNTDVRIRRIKL